MNKLSLSLLRLAMLATLLAAMATFTCQLAAAQVVQTNSNAPKLKWTLKGHQKSIIEILFSPDGETVATGSEDGTVRLWNARTGQERATLKLSKKPERLRLVWSPDSRYLATCPYRGFGQTREAGIWDAQTGARLATLDGHGSALRQLEWSPDGQTILTSSDDGTAKLWDAATWGLRRTIEYERVEVSRETHSMLAAVFTRKKFPGLRNVRARFVAGGRNIVIFSFNNPPQLWSLEGQLIASLVTPTGLIARPNTSYLYYSEPDFSPDGRFIATTESRTAHLWDARTGELRHTFAEESAHLFTPDGRTLITAAWEIRNLGFFELPDVVIKLRDVETGALRQVWPKSVSGVNHIYVSRAGESIVVNGTGKTKARLLDPTTGAIKARLPYEGCSESLFSEDTGCEPFIFSADGRIASKLTGTLKLFDAATGEPLAVLANTDRRAAFSPTDARLLAARSKDKKSLMLFEVSAR